MWTPPIIRRLTANDFFRHNLIAFIGSVGVAALNYLYYPVLGRVMSPADFGEVQALNSLFLQIVIFLGVFNFVVVGAVAKSDDPAVQNRLIAELEKLATLIAVTIAAILLVFAPQITAFFRLQATAPYLLLLVALLLSVPGAVRTAYLQGRRDFGGIAVAGAITALGKLLIGLALVLVGWRTFGAMVGVVVAQVLTLAYATWLIRRHGWRRPGGFSRTKLPDLALLRPELAFATLVFIATFSLNCFLSIDILAVKHWFDPHTAGLYGGIETLGRIVFFINVSVAGVLLPSVKLSRPAHENRQLLYRSLAVVVALGAGVLTVFALAPRLLVQILMGAKFLPYADLLPRLGLFMFLAAIINLLCNYYLAQRRWFIAGATASGLVLTLLALGLHHATPGAVVESLIMGGVLTLGLVAVFRWAAGPARYSPPLAEPPKKVSQLPGLSR